MVQFTGRGRRRKNVSPPRCEENALLYSSDGSEVSPNKGDGTNDGEDFQFGMSKKWQKRRHIDTAAIFV